MPEAAARSYHHGRLREAVMEAALQEIEAVGPARMSMREIARRAGVSHAAPAHHFGDKTGIFTAIAAEGHRLLADAVRAEVLGPDPLVRCGMGYVRFAVAHRAHFEVMFRPDLCDMADPDLAEAADASFAVLLEAVRRTVGPVDEPEIMTVATASWALVHGFATLWLGGNIQKWCDDEMDVVLRRTFEGTAMLGAALGRSNSADTR